MQSINYTELGNKINKTLDQENKKIDYISLNSIIDTFENSSLNFIEQSSIYKSYIIELEKVLSNSKIEACIKDLYGLEARLLKLKEVAPIDYEVPELEEFWKSLSKTILLSLWESLENEEQTNEVVRGWYESLRIAIETQLYCVKEKWG